MRVALGFTLQPEERYLALLARVLREECDYHVVAPETTWRADGRGAFAPNGFHRVFLELQRETGKPCVGHGVGFSLGSARRDPARDARWLARLREDQAAFRFAWYSDHLGATVLDGLELALPLPLPQTERAARSVRGALDLLATIAPAVGFENSAFYFRLGQALDEPAWIARALQGPRRHLVLDLHNLHTDAVNAGFEAQEYLARLPLERVVEIHLAGGSQSEPAWLPSRRSLRLDSHDRAVPEEVWRLLERALPGCPALRGVTLERMEGTVEQGDVSPLAAELGRARRILELARAR